jgi:hypothetical protein
MSINRIVTVPLLVLAAILWQTHVCRSKRLGGRRSCFPFPAASPPETGNSFIHGAGEARDTSALARVCE